MNQLVDEESELTSKMSKKKEQHLTKQTLVVLTESAFSAIPAVCVNSEVTFQFNVG